MVVAPIINSMALYYGLCGSISGDLLVLSLHNIHHNLITQGLLTYS
jgi:mannose/fructose/N-acetylgalactosamine-specific phosphotransferase system component IID